MLTWGIVRTAEKTPWRVKVRKTRPSVEAIMIQT
jgi:hypothetical protein